MRPALYGGSPSPGTPTPSRAGMQPRFAASPEAAFKQSGHSPRRLADAAAVQRAGASPRWGGASPVPAGKASPITPLGSYLLDGDPWTRQHIEWALEYQPTHHHFLVTAFTHTARRLWAVAERYKRICLKEAWMDWRDLAVQDKLDGRLKQAAQVLKDQLKECREEQRRTLHRDGSQTRTQWAQARSPHSRTSSRGAELARPRSGQRGIEDARVEADALAKRLAVIGDARRALPAVTRLARSLARIQRQRLVVSVAQWKDATTLPHEAWLAMTTIRQYPSASDRYRFFGATEAELHAELLPATLRASRRREMERRSLQAGSGDRRIGADLLQSALRSHRARTCAYAFAKIRAEALRRPRTWRGGWPSLDYESEEESEDEEFSDENVISPLSSPGRGSARLSAGRDQQHSPRVVPARISPRLSQQRPRQSVSGSRRSSSASRGSRRSTKALDGLSFGQEGPQLVVHLDVGKLDKEGGLSKDDLMAMVEAMQHAQKGHHKQHVADAYHVGEGRTQRASTRIPYSMSYWEGGDGEDSSDGWPSWKAHSSDSERDKALPLASMQRRHEKRSTQASVNAEELFSQPSELEGDAVQQDRRHSTHSTRSSKSRHSERRSQVVHQALDELSDLGHRRGSKDVVSEIGGPAGMDRKPSVTRELEIGDSSGRGVSRKPSEASLERETGVTRDRSNTGASMKPQIGIEGPPPSEAVPDLPHDVAAWPGAVEERHPGGIIRERSTSGIVREPASSGIAVERTASGIARETTASMSRERTESNAVRDASASGITRERSASGISREPAASGITRERSISGIVREPANNAAVPLAPELAASSAVPRISLRDSAPPPSSADATAAPRDIAVAAGAAAVGAVAGGTVVAGSMNPGSQSEATEEDEEEGEGDGEDGEEEDYDYNAEEGEEEEELPLEV